jgi:hypothetical protein
MLAEKLREHGVVGAGGAGFPTCVKARAEAEIMIANGAECEPLIHKDVELMQAFPGEILSGLRLMAEAVGARRMMFAIKSKNAQALDAVRSRPEAKDVELVLLGDFYPSGDEYEVVYTATGRLIPPAGLPLHVGCVVNNVETLYNVWRAQQDVPVTEKFLSVSGAVREPCAFWAPVGVTFPRSDRAGRRGHGSGLCGFRQRHHDGHADLRSGRSRHQDHRRVDRAAPPASAGCTQEPAGGGPEPHRQIGLRPVQLLHGVLPALPVGLRGHAAQGHAQPRFHGQRFAFLEPVGRIVLRLRPLHALRLPGGSLSQRSLRPGQTGPARSGGSVSSRKARCECIP